MQKQIRIILAMILLLALVVFTARWWMPLLGLAGAGNEMMQPLEGFAPWAVWLALAACAWLAIHLHWDRLLNLRKPPRRLVEEAETWSDDFRIGAELDTTTADLNLDHTNGDALSTFDPAGIGALAQQTPRQSAANAMEQAQRVAPLAKHPAGLPATGSPSHANQLTRDQATPAHRPVVSPPAANLPTEDLANAIIAPLQTFGRDLRDLDDKGKEDDDFADADEDSNANQPMLTWVGPATTRPAIPPFDGSKKAAPKPNGAAGTPYAVPVSQAQRVAAQRVTMAFPDEPATELVAIGNIGNGTTTVPHMGGAVRLASQETEAPNSSAAEIAHAATTAQAEAFPIGTRQMPAVPTHFFGRQTELARLQQALTQPQNALLGIFGAAGVGKTALALKLAQQVAERYPSAQFYLDLKGTSPQPLAPLEAQTHVLRALRPADALPESDLAIAQAYEAALTGQRALLVLDNAASVNQVEALLPPVGNLAIVTARQPLPLTGVFTQWLGTLPADEAPLLLSQQVPRSKPEAAHIAALCGNLPLALRLAGSTLLERIELAPETYVQQLTEAAQQQPAHSLHAHTEPDTETATTETAAARALFPPLLVAYKLLSPGLQKLWRMLAVFPDSLDVTGAGALWGIHPERAMKALKRLHDFHLLEVNYATGRYRLHDLKRRVADGLLQEPERSISWQRHAEYYQSVLHEADALYEQGGAALKRGLHLLDLEWHNIAAGQQWAMQHAAQSEAAQELCSSYPDAGKFVLELRQPPRDRIRWCHAALEAARQLKRRKAEGRHLITLGKAYWQLNEMAQAREAYEQALLSTRETADQSGEARALNGLGAVLQANSAQLEARAHHAEALKLARTASDARSAAIALGGLARTHYEMGELPKALNLLEQQLTIMRQLGDQRGTASALGGLGLVYYSRGEGERALQFLSEQLHLAREIGDLSGEAAALSNLGHACAELGRFDDSLHYHEQALALMRTLHDPRGEANALGGVGIAWYLKGDVARSILFLEQQLALARQTQDQRAEALALGNLGEAYFAQGNVAYAIAMQEAAAELSAKIGDVVGQAYALFNQALALSGNQPRAITLARQALALFEAAENNTAQRVKAQLIEWENNARTKHNTSFDAPTDPASTAEAQSDPTAP